MNEDWNIIGPDSLKFFGKITATVTHELNNTLGIINENAGLIEDLAMISKQGNPPDIDKWMEITQKIGDQVKRTNEIVNNLNSFAHSTDHSKAVVNPDRLLRILVTLSTRQLAEKKVIALVINEDEIFDFYIQPFLFLNLLGDCLLYAADNADENKKILISISHDVKMISITFSGLMIENDISDFYKTKKELLNVLDAKITYEKDKNSLLVFLNEKKSG